MRRVALGALACALAACAETELLPADANLQPDATPLPDARVRVDAMPDAAVDPPPRYTTDRTHSPINRAVAENLAGIALRGGATLRDDVFAKVGDSITVAPQFMTCFAGSAVELGASAGLADTLAHFKAGSAAGTTPYERVSAAAGIGWSADAVLDDDPPPSPLATELGQIMPRYAIVMYGSNDAAARSPFQFGANLLEILDQLAAQGVVPLLSTVPPNDTTTTVGSELVSARIPRYNAIIRGVAQARLVPLMDYWREMNVLPAHGLSGDKLHPNVYSGGECKLTPDGLMFGYNVRNKLALEALDRARRVVEGEAPPDIGVPAATTGKGTHEQPFVVGALPFGDLRDTSASTNVISTYPGCAATQNESGPEYVYKLTLQSRARVRALVIVRPGVDVDVHLLSGTGTMGSECVLRHDRELVLELAAGTHWFVLDTFVPAATGTPSVGEYLFVLVPE